MRLVILGGTGFLGSRLAACLAVAGHDVVGVARHRPATKLPAGVGFVQATIDDRAALAPVLAAADAVLHLAWDTTPGTSAKQPSMEAYNNVLPTLRFLEELQQHPRCGLLFVSTGGALFPTADGPVPESAEMMPRSYYGAAKASVELMLHAFRAQAGNAVRILRPSNVYGPGQSAKRGFGIVPTLMQCARDGLPFETWGSGQTARDFLYIEDFERLVTAMFATPWQAGTIERYNAGSGAAVSIDTLCALVEEVTGSRIRRHPLPARTVDPPQTLLDSSKALSHFGWKAGTPLRAGLETTWAWFRQAGT